MGEKSVEPIVVSATEALYCPREEDRLWNQHPRVFLSFDAHGEAVCPYCSARYRADGAKKVNH